MSYDLVACKRFLVYPFGTYTLSMHKHPQRDYIHCDLIIKIGSESCLDDVTQIELLVSTNLPSLQRSKTIKVSSHWTKKTVFINVWHQTKQRNNKNSPKKTHYLSSSAFFSLNTTKCSLQF